jgi:mannose-6-phosphate isomerase-like protein (cupin superfamily)
MPKLIASPTQIASVGNITKYASEYIGLVNTGDGKLSITLVHSPAGWQGVGQYSDYREYRVVYKGLLRVEHEGGTLDVESGQGLDISPGEWVRYSSPGDDGADYVTVCVPAFSRAGVHRDEQ